MVDQWARCRRQPYKGDLCQIVGYDEAKAWCTVKVIPRVDLKSLIEDMKLPRGHRQPKKPVFMDDVLRMGGQVQRVNEKVWGCAGLRFDASGYLLMDCKLQAVDWKSPQTTVEDIQVC